MSSPNLFLLLCGLCLTSLFVSSCEEEIFGCTDPLSTSYNPDATENDGSCSYEGCTDPQAENYNELATVSDSNCIYPWDKFIGMYYAEEDCPSAQRIWSMEILPGSTPYLDVEIKNINDSGTTFNAIIQGNQIIFDYMDPVGSIRGTGTINGATLFLMYEVNIPFLNESEMCSAVCQKL